MRRKEEQTRWKASNVLTRKEEVGVGKEEKAIVGRGGEGRSWKGGEEERRLTIGGGKDPIYGDEG